ncbi:hypothetical protein [Ruegeria arenilitoris]|uniref:hypothetical protein n=1 Tax=Ruegeria arenilitoris TaxID=1173585 RepID=UPI00147F901C|nr:hypothetical protein [Ruegeria arenilitoris]
MSKPKPDPFANFPRIDTTSGIMRRLKVSRKEAERLAALKTGEVGALDFFAMRLLNLDGADPERDHIMAETAYTAARSAHEEAAGIALSERQRDAARKPRPKSRHPLRDELVREGVRLLESGEKQAFESAAVEVLARYAERGTDGLPHFNTVSRWLRLEYVQR